MKQIKFLQLFFLCILFGGHSYGASAFGAISNLNVGCFDNSSINFTWDVSNNSGLDGVSFHIYSGGVYTYSITFSTIKESYDISVSSNAYNTLLSGDHNSVFVVGRKNGVSNWSDYDAIGFSMTENQIDFENFRWGKGMWNEGNNPGDIRRLNSSNCESNKCMRLRGFSNILSDEFDASGFNSLQFIGIFKTVGFNSGDRFKIEFDRDFGGSSAFTVVQKRIGNPAPENWFDNHRQLIEFKVSCAGGGRAKINIVCEAFSQGKLYVDDIIIIGHKPDGTTAKLSNAFLENNLIIKNDNRRLQKEELFEFSFYPNPATNRLRLGFDESSSTGVISILSLEGKELLKISNDSFEMELDVSKLSKGLYLIRYESGEKSSVKKLMID